MELCHMEVIARLSCLTGSSVVNVSGLFLPAVVRPILDSFETPKQAPPPALSEVRTTVYCTFTMITYNFQLPITMLVHLISSVACADVSEVKILVLIWYSFGN